MQLDRLLNMGNCIHRSIGKGLEETTMSIASTSAPLDKTTNFHNIVEECLTIRCNPTLGNRSGGGPSMEQKSQYFSTRIEELMQSRSQFFSNVEHEIEHSKVHWSEVIGLSEVSEDDSYEDEEVSRENREIFAKLLKDPQWTHHQHGHFFWEWERYWKLGRKIAEGGQATIFEILDPNLNVPIDYVLKVFKRGSRLSDLRKQWPCGMLRGEVDLNIAFRATMLDDGRFAFWMVRCWGDLRKLIDQAMQEKNNQGPPFPYKWNGKTLIAKYIMKKIASHMAEIHEQGIIHRDLKAANILLLINKEHVHVFVGDFECSIGVIGTGFWRAPEILLALKNKCTIDFTEKMDVYSYGMICFEVITGRLPFEGELKSCRASNDLIIAGQRPKLPSDLDVPLKGLIEKCWNSIPNKRPSFKEIVKILNAL